MSSLGQLAPAAGFGITKPSLESPDSKSLSALVLNPLGTLAVQTGPYVLGRTLYVDEHFASSTPRVPQCVDGVSPLKKVEAMGDEEAKV
jgi:hypothetical protein